MIVLSGKRYKLGLADVYTRGMSVQKIMGPRERLPCVCDAFYRVSKDSEGSGLGLSIVKATIRGAGRKDTDRKYSRAGEYIQFYSTEG